MYDIRQMRFLLFLQGKYILGYDCKHYIAQKGHMFQDMGLYTYFLSKLCLTNNPCLLNILVYIQNRDLLGSHLSMYILHLCIVHWIHMVRDCKDLLEFHLK